ncbi:MAG TPA: SH3 domain-containing protein [Clostridia bacterium]|nr:SH3 domain-containing protein [Clostridia bacterium]
MHSMAELVEEIERSEKPLVELYRQIEDAAVTSTEKKLASQMYHYQRFQVASLELLKSDVPEEFLCFGAVVDEDVNLRQGPGPKHSLVKKVGKGTPVIVMKYEGNWAHVRLPDATQGFIFRAYVKCEMGA